MFADDTFLYIENPKDPIKQTGAPGWLSQLSLTLHFGSGHDLMIPEFEPCMGLCTNSVGPVWDSVSFSLCPSLACSLYLSQDKNKQTNCYK